MKTAGDFYNDGMAIVDDYVQKTMVIKNELDAALAKLLKDMQAGEMSEATIVNILESAGKRMESELGALV